jgi:hypothetical protein
MGTRVAVGRQFRYPGAEAAERESQNENSACRPDGRIGSRHSRLALGRNGSRMLGDVRCLPMSFHRADPLIGNFDSRACRVSLKTDYAITRLRTGHSDKFPRHFHHAYLKSSAMRTQRAARAVLRW